MSRTISYLFTQSVYVAEEGDPRHSFRENIEYHYGHFFASKSVVRYTTISAGFAVTLLGTFRELLSAMLEDDAAKTSGQILGFFITLTPIFSAFIISNANIDKSKDELKRLINYGIQNGYFRSSKNSSAAPDEEKAENPNLPLPEKVETSEHTIRYQMGLSR